MLTGTTQHPGEVAGWKKNRVPKYRNGNHEPPKRTKVRRNHIDPDFNDLVETMSCMLDTNDNVTRYIRYTRLSILQHKTFGTRVVLEDSRFAWDDLPVQKMALLVVDLTNKRKKARNLYDNYDWDEWRSIPKNQWNYLIKNKIVLEALKHDHDDEKVK